MISLGGLFYYCFTTFRIRLGLDFSSKIFIFFFLAYYEAHRSIFTVDLENTLLLSFFSNNVFFYLFFFSPLTYTILILSLVFWICCIGCYIPNHDPDVFECFPCSPHPFLSRMPKLCLMFPRTTHQVWAKWEDCIETVERKTSDMYPR